MPSSCACFRIDTIPKPVGLGWLSSCVKRCQVGVKRCQENHAKCEH